MSATVWAARAEVVRVSDGQARLRTSSLEVTDIEVDCSGGREQRRLVRDEAIGRPAEALITALLRP